MSGMYEVDFAELVAKAPVGGGAVGKPLPGGDAAAVDSTGDGKGDGKGTGAGKGTGKEAGAKGADDDADGANDDANSGTGDGADGAANDGASDDAGAGDGDEDTDGGDGGSGDNDDATLPGDDGVHGDAAVDDAALLAVAKDFGIESLEGLDERTVKMLQALVAAKSTADDEEAELTEYEARLLDEAGDGADDDGQAAAEATAATDKDGKKETAAPDLTSYSSQEVKEIVTAFLEGKLNLPFKDFGTKDGGYYAVRQAAIEAKDHEALTELEHAAFLVRARQFVLPMIEKILGGKLAKLDTLDDAFEKEVKPVIEDRQRQKNISAVNEARLTAITQVTSLKGFGKDFTRFLEVDPKAPPVSIKRGKQTVKFASSPLAHTLRANPELLDIAVKGKDGTIDTTATFIRMYRVAYKLRNGAKAQGNGLSKATAEQMLRAGAKGAERAEKKAAAGGLTKGTGTANTQGKGPKGGDKDTNWAGHYRNL